MLVCLLKDDLDKYRLQKQNKKIGCVAANPRFLHGKPLYYGTIGLLNGNICLRYKINVILAKGYRIVVLRRKPDAMTLLLNVKRFHTILEAVMNSL